MIVEENAALGSVIRNIGAAWRSTRLYPAGSPMSLQAAQTVLGSIEEYLEAEPSLKLGVVRGGFIMRGLDGVFGGPGVPEIAEALVSHGVGEVHFVAPPAAEELVALMAATHERPVDLAERGGMVRVLGEAGVGTIKIVPLVLSKVEAPPEIPEEEADKFLAELAADPERLAMWLRSLLACDDEGLIDGILTLATAAGDVRMFGRSMSGAFLELDSDEKDRLLEASIELEPVRHVTVEMLANLSVVELTAAIRGGRYGSNLMALSYALTSVPVGGRAQELWQETTSALRAADVGEEQLAFLDNMIAARRAVEPEPPLVDAQPIHRAALASTVLSPEHVESAREDVAARRWLDGAGAGTILHLLDIADEFGAYTRVLLALSRSVPHLLEVGELDLAMAVVRQIQHRAATSEKPWPELAAEFVRATKEACGARSMAALLATSSTVHDQAVEYAKEFVTLGGETAARELASAALESDAEDAMGLAGDVLGRRLPELLAPEARATDHRHVAGLAELFAHDGGPRPMQALAQLVARPEDRVRSETARGIGAGGGTALRSFMPKLIRDESREVAIVAVRSLARNGGEGTVELLAGRLLELEGDKDIALAREIISVLGDSPAPAAGAALQQTASRGGLLRRGRYAEMKRLAEEALAARKSRGYA
ncbi:MAG: hypothetical protein C0418_02000 [Coriobacteriaceae bacterium]|nr:hypothetical protein [Coriobacteriaceae bacterium]